MKTMLSLFCVIAFVLPAHAQSSLNGRWEARFANPQGAQTLVVFDLKSSGDHITGTVTSESGSLSIQNGKVKGNTLTFDVAYIVPYLYNRFGVREIVTRIKRLGAPANAITGTLTNDIIRFSQHDWRGETTEFEARRVK